jgi:hypothetical protein
MLTRAILLILSSLSLQAVCWNAGGPTILKQNGVSVECFEDQLFSGGTKFVDLTMGVGVFQTLRYGNFSYTIPAAPGLYTVTLDLVEPNKTGSGQRLFYVAVNGVRTANLDLWQLAGGANKQPYILKLYGVSNGQLKIEFVTVLWNAVVSAIHVEQMKPLDIVYGLGHSLRKAQTLFEKTGGLHAAGVFDEHGVLYTLHEDVGRHNAVDKAIGHMLLQDRSPLDHHILMVSGRASFEIMQKAVMARMLIVCAVSAPSSLAVEAAERFGMTLVGFLRGDGFNIYTHDGRIDLHDLRRNP